MFVKYQAEDSIVAAVASRYFCTVITMTVVAVVIDFRRVRN